MQCACAILSVAWPAVQYFSTLSHKRHLKKVVERKACWGDPDVDGRIILRWIFRKFEGLWGLEGVGSG
jgi:hypothetical protein